MVYLTKCGLCGPLVGWNLVIPSMVTIIHLSPAANPDCYTNISTVKSTSAAVNNISCILNFLNFSITKILEDDQATLLTLVLFETSVKDSVQFHHIALISIPIPIPILASASI